MDAPERIWAVHHETLGAVMIGEWADTVRHFGGTEYIRAEHHAATIARLTAERDEARMEAIAAHTQAQEAIGAITEAPQ